MEAKWPLKTTIDGLRMCKRLIVAVPRALPPVEVIMQKERKKMIYFLFKKGCDK